jgi:hypothetical protein
MTEITEAEVLVRKYLVVDSPEVVLAMVTRAKSVLMLDTQGNVFLKAPKHRLTHRQLILALLLGRNFSAVARLRAANTATVPELSKFCGASAAVVRARTSALKEEGRIEPVGRGSWRIVEAKAEEILEELESAVQKAKA